jgi:hypothetical protein
MLVKPGQRAGMPQRDGAYMGVWFAAETGVVAAKRFALRSELEVDFKANDRLVGFVFHNWKMQSKAAKLRLVDDLGSA